MKKLLLILVILIAAIGCKKDEQLHKNACNNTNPIEEVDWLKELKNSMTNCECEISIIQGTYKEQTVFFVAMTDPLCDGIDMPTLYDCNGNVVKTFTSNDYQEFYKDVSRDRILYRCKTSG